MKRPIYLFIIFIAVICLSSILYKTYEDFTNSDNKYVYILSNTSKSLSFDTLGQNSFIYVDPQTPTVCDVKTDMPQKWNINIINPNETNQANMAFTITSYNQNGVKYYLTANADGSVSASLFGGSTNQKWLVVPVLPDPNNSQPNQLPKINIQSRQYNTYLAATNSGYIKDKAGNVYLANTNQNVETLWQIMAC